MDSKNTILRVEIFFYCVMDMCRDFSIDVNLVVSFESLAFRVQRREVVWGRFEVIGYVSAVSERARLILVKL